MVSQSKSVLITGCSSGIGYAAAKTLQIKGYDVIATCRKETDVVRLLDEGFKKVIQLDLADSQSIQSAVRDTLELTGGNLYALFNNGAYGLPGALEDISREALRRQFEVNVFGTHELTRALIPTLLKQKSARIIQNSSILGFVAMPNRGAYIASKYALEGLTDTLRIELANTGIQCSLIEPGPIISQFRKNALEAFQREINIAESRHQEMYQAALKRLKQDGPGMKFTLPESAVVQCLVHALENPKPKIRYKVTVPTYVIAYLKRLISSKMLDRFILRFGSA